MGLFRDTSRSQSGCRFRKQITPQHPRGGVKMLKKVPLVLSILAALGFAVAISAPADAKQQQQSTKSSSHVTKSFNRTNVRVNTRTNVRTNVRTNKIGSGRTNVRTNKISSGRSKLI